MQQTIWTELPTKLLLALRLPKEEHMLESCQPKEDPGIAFGNAPARQF